MSGYSGLPEFSKWHQLSMHLSLVARELSNIPSSGKIVGDEFGCIRGPGQILFELPRDNVIFKVTINLNGRIGPKEINSFLKKKKSSRKTSRLVVIYPCWLVFLALLCARGHASLHARWLAFPSELVQCEIYLLQRTFLSQLHKVFIHCNKFSNLS